MQFPSEQEQKSILNHILRPFLLTILERDKKVIEQSGVKFKSPYIDLMNQAIKKIEQDIIQNKKLLRQYGIRIYSENQTDSGIEVKYTFKNFHHLFNPSFDKIKSEVEKMMKEYLK